jgi:hypothetical protein
MRDEGSGQDQSSLQSFVLCRNRLLMFSLIFQDQGFPDIYLGARVKLCKTLCTDTYTPLVSSADNQRNGCEKVHCHKLDSSCFSSE